MKFGCSLTGRFKKQVHLILSGYIQIWHFYRTCSRGHFFPGHTTQCSFICYWYWVTSALVWNGMFDVILISVDHILREILFIFLTVSKMWWCHSKLYSKQESIDFPEQMRFVNLQRLLLGLQTVKLSTSVSLKNEQVPAFIVQRWIFICLHCTFAQCIGSCSVRFSYTAR